MGLSLKTSSYYDNGGGLNQRSSPTKLREEEASVSLNMDYSTDGAFYTRNGSIISNQINGIPQQMANAVKTLGFYDYKKSDGTIVRVVSTEDSIKHGLVNPTNAVTGISDAYPDMEFQVTLDDEFLFWGNGVDDNLKFNGTNWTNWSIARPAAPVPVDNGVGVLGAGDYSYYYSFARTVSGVIVQESELSPVGTVTIAANRQIRVNISTSTDPQVNARVIYRISPTSLGVAYRLTIVTNNVATFYDDNTPADGVIEAEFDNQAAPTTAIFESFQGRMYMVDASRSTDLYASKINKPWNVPTENVILFDGPIQCLKRLYGVLIIGTDKSLWVLAGDFETNEPRRISSITGILNNRCADGIGPLYFLGTNGKVYSLSPTAFANDELRIDEPLSDKVEPFISNVIKAQPANISLKYYSKPNVAKVILALPYGGQENNYLLIYNEEQAFIQKQPVWHIWNNINVSAFGLFSINGQIALYSGDYNGFLWELDVDYVNGDGAEENGTATSATNTTIEDLSKTWDVNAFVGKIVRIIGGSGVDQFATITSNTATEITFDPPFVDVPDNTSEYTIGGYDAIHFTNWKKVTGSYDVMKQLWFILGNLNAVGDYTVSLIIQSDFNIDPNNQIVLNLNLQGNNSIWGQFIWGDAIWGAQAVFQKRLRAFRRFKSLRLGFQNRKAGQPFQVNGFSISAQEKAFFERTTP